MFCLDLNVTEVTVRATHYLFQCSQPMYIPLHFSFLHSSVDGENVQSKRAFFHRYPFLKNSSALMGRSYAFLGKRARMDRYGNLLFKFVLQSLRGTLVQPANQLLQ